MIYANVTRKESIILPIKEKKMEQLTLSIKFFVSSENKELFKTTLVDLFDQISKEPSFINASLHEGIENPNEILVFENWGSSVEEFLTYQMAKDYRIPFEQFLKDFNVRREPGIFAKFAQWG